MPIMHQWILTTLVSTLLLTPGWAQFQQIELLPAQTSFTASELQLERNIPQLEEGPFYTVAILWESSHEQASLEISFQANGVWTPWKPVAEDHHHTLAAPQALSPLLYISNEVSAYRLRSVQPHDFDRIRVDFYNPGYSDQNPSPNVVHSNRDFCPCPQPGFAARLDWCPDGSCPMDPTPFFTEVTHLIVHHSAGVNSSSDWAAVVRSIWNFHVNSNGWDDIGYNWLIDANGVIYQGRGDNWQGAHFCGTNGGTMGVCMLGTYTDILPTPNAQTSLKELLAWKCCQESIDPLDFSFHGSSGLSLFHISGHRDGCATACPGDTFYPTLEAMRDSVHNYINTECSGIAGPTQLAAFTPNGEEVTLSWTDNTNDETGFLIERSPSGQNTFEQVGFVAADVTNFNEDITVDANGLDYRIRSFNNTDTSLYSNVATVTYVNSVYRNKLEGVWDVQPNPAQDQLWVRWEHNYRGSIQWQVIDPLGRVAWQRSSMKQAEEWTGTLFLGDLARGMYFLVLRTEGQTVSKKIILE
ncbi:MAG: N-acetylmuramoyl-L-alanine amidase [Bacteroidota bacterium]